MCAQRLRTVNATAVQLGRQVLLPDACPDHQFGKAFTAQHIARTFKLAMHAFLIYSLMDSALVQAFLLAAMKFHCYVKALPLRTQADSELAWTVIQGGIEYLCDLVKTRVKGACRRCALVLHYLLTVIFHMHSQLQVSMCCNAELQQYLCIGGALLPSFECCKGSEQYSADTGLYACAMSTMDNLCTVCTWPYT